MIEDTNAADSGLAGKVLGKVQSAFKNDTTFKVKQNDWQARFAPSSDKAGMLRYQKDSLTLVYRPVNANKNVAPKVRQSQEGQVIVYENLWNGINVEYEVTGSKIKEYIVINDRNSRSQVEFKVDGAILEPMQDRPGAFKVVGHDVIVSELSVSLNQIGVISDPVVEQKYEDWKIKININEQWLRNLPQENFPVVIDPTTTGHYGTGLNYAAFKSDGYVCGSNSCYMNVGSLNDRGWKHWRTIFCPNYNDFIQPQVGRRVAWAGLYLRKKNPPPNSWFGVPEGRWFEVSHATSWQYNSINWGLPRTSAWFAQDGWIDMTPQMQYFTDNRIPGACFVINGEEVAGNTMKSFIDNAIMQYTYTDQASMTAPTTPSDKEVLVTDQPTLSINPSSSPNGDQVRYYFRVATNPDGETGTVFNSGDIDSTTWTLPEGTLQDGVTYYWRAYSSRWLNGQNWGYTTPNWVRSFKVDLRNGKDSSQTYDSAGPVSVNLATGNATTSASTHTMNALGGNIGVGLEYNSPYRAKPGLVAEYFSNANFSGSPVLTRVESKVDNQWGTGSPSAGTVPIDSFSAKYKGYFVVPKTGSYQFGAQNDDYAEVIVNGQTVYVNGGCYSSFCYGTSANPGLSIALSEGDVVPIEVRHVGGGGPDFIRLAVKGAIPEQVVPTDMLRTEPRLVNNYQGLHANYYYDSGNHVVPSSPSSAFASRRETKISFNWGGGSPVPTGPADSWMASYDGFITAPTTGSYQFGVNNDDAARVWVNGQLVTDDWADDGVVGAKWGSGINLTGGVAAAIRIEYYEKTGSASLYLNVRGAVAEQEVPSSWLSVKAPLLSNGWNISLDADGSLKYDYAIIRQSAVLLVNADGSTDEYTWNGTTYKAPENEYGILVKNSDNSLTLQDADGMTYIFGADGLLKSATSPADDRKPTALQYEYSSSPARLSRVVDPVDPSRFGTVRYKGDSACPSAPTGFDAEAPGNMICAFDTTDGDSTKFFYINSQLARIELPGGDITDIRHDSLGRIIQQRSSLANDAIQAGVRVDDASVTTELAYDSLGRVSKVTEPAPNAGDARREHVYRYGTSQMTSLNRLYQPAGPTTHILTNSTSLANTSNELWTMAFALKTQLPGTQPINQCQRPDGTYFSTANSACYGSPHVFKGVLGYLYPAPTGSATVPISRLGNPSGYTLEYPAVSLAGWATHEIIGYGFPTMEIAGSTYVNISSTSEPNGYTQKIEYDRLYRTVKAYDKAGNVSLAEYDAVKDLSLSSTAATGLKSTTIYDQNDLPVESYGPAPKEWFDASRKPLAAYLNQVPRSETKYDEGISGPSVAWYNSKNDILLGAPKLHTTGTSPGSNRVAYDGNKPITVESGNTGIGLRATGKITLPGTGNYTFYGNVDGTNDGYKLIIDGKSVISKPTTSGGMNQTATFAAVAGKQYDFLLEYIDTGNTGYMSTFVQGPGLPAQASYVEFNHLIKPQYNLTTSTKVYDNLLGDTVTTTNYGNSPELGLPVNTIDDAGGLNLGTSMTYEAQGVPGGYLRQTSKTLPGGNAYSYQHYGNNEAIDNPCTPENDAVSQAGFPRGKTEPDPDGAGPLTGRSATTVYDKSGKVVATRFNSDPWTCTYFDSRGRNTRTEIPSIDSKPSRTIVNEYAVGGNPLKSSSSDNFGTISTEVDLLGRTKSYIDTHGNTTTSNYDGSGKLSSRTSPLGTEEYVYDNLDRLVVQKLDSVTFATVSYDNFSRITSIVYPAGQTATYTRDNLDRLKKITYGLASSQTISDDVNRSVAGDIVSGIENGIAKSYSYDGSSRLTSAVIGNNTFTYTYGVSNPACNSLTGNNPNAFKNSNRSSMTTNSQSTYYCYDQADRLIFASDSSISSPVYDSHGNTTQIGSNGNVVSFGYDGNGRNVSITNASQSTTYVRDVQNRITERTSAVNNETLKTKYGFTAGSDTPDFVTNESNSVTEKYLTLPGSVVVTIRVNRPSASGTTYSLPNIHGDVMATVNADGLLEATHMTGPFGEQLANSLTPNNATRGTSYNYTGQHQKLTETNYTLPGGIIQMGQRVYIPLLGRFLQVDPIEGGTDNAYVYPGDPVNDFDLDGTFSVKKFVKDHWRKAATGAVAVATGVAVAGCVVATAGICAGVAATVVVSGGIGAAGGAAAYATRNAGTKEFSAKWMGAAAGASGVGSAMIAGAPSGLLKLRNLMNNNNILRIGNGRVSAGPAPKYYNKGGPSSKIPIHIHLEKLKGGMNLLKSGKSIRFWGKWR